jgi:hypothetical protein
MTVFTAAAKRNCKYLHLFLLLLLPVLPPEAAEGAFSVKKLTERKIDALAERYAAAVEKRDFEAWKALLSPLHPVEAANSRELFLEKADEVESISVKAVEGRTVSLIVEFVDGHEEPGYLQLHSSGHIKYAPLVFRHPVVKACALVQILLYDYSTLLGSTTTLEVRQDTVAQLHKLKIPLCGYDPKAPVAISRREAAENILSWLETYGGSFDSTVPRIPIVPEELFRCLEKTRTAIH